MPVVQYYIDENQNENTHDDIVAECEHKPSFSRSYFKLTYRVCPQNPLILYKDIEMSDEYYAYDGMSMVKNSCHLITTSKFI